MNPDNTNYPGWKKPDFRIMYCSDVVQVVEIESRIEASRKVGEEGDGRLLHNGSGVSAWEKSKFCRQIVVMSAQDVDIMILDEIHLNW